jgi:hypothetical protein
MFPKILAGIVALGITLGLFYYFNPTKFAQFLPIFSPTTQPTNNNAQINSTYNSTPL